MGLIAWGLSFNGITPLDVESPAGVAGLELRAAGANPVRGAGQLAFTLPRAGDIRLDLLDVQGRMVRGLLQGTFEAGSHFASWNARGLDPGVYFVRLTVDRRETREVKVTVVR